MRKNNDLCYDPKTAGRNCGRMMMMAQDGLCGGCWCRTKGLIGAAYDEALAKAKADFGGVPEGERAPQRKFYRGPQVKPQAAPDAEYKKPAEIVEPHPGQIEKPSMAFEALPADHMESEGPLLSIIVNFNDGDGPLFYGLMALGRKYRRSPDQQLLWLLEKELHNERLLDDDPPRRSMLDAEATVTIAAREAGNAG